MRCHHEYVQHESTLFVTLTYRNDDLPPTLTKRHLQLYLKRLRKALSREQPAIRIRFFAAGEYGEGTHRPHYHLLLFGAQMRHQKIVEECWPYGDIFDTQQARPESIPYVAGYCAKKYTEVTCTQKQRVDQRTGEVYEYQPPFQLMSRGGRNGKGIGHHARDQYTDSWKEKAITNSITQRVPRYYKEKWTKQATPMQIEKHQNEKEELMKVIRRTPEQRRAAETRAKEQQKIQAARRTKM